MDSKEYFVRAEKSNKLYRRTAITLLVLLVLGQSIVIAVLFKVNDNNHRNAVDSLNVITQNEVKLNQNLSNSIQCILHLTPQTFTSDSVNICFEPSNNITAPKGK